MAKKSKPAQKASLESVRTRHDEEEGTWHIEILTVTLGWLRVGAECREDEAEAIATDLHRWKHDGF